MAQPPDMTPRYDVLLAIEKFDEHGHDQVIRPSKG
jgi:hypothetical protein